jgi:beta-glucosidase
MPSASHLRRLTLLLRAAVAVSVASVASAATSAPDPGGLAPGAAPAALESSVGQLLAAMTLREKVAQMIQAEVAYITPAQMREHCLGSVLNGGGSYPSLNRRASAADWVALADAFYNASTDTTACRFGIPAIWGTDAVHGHNNVMGATLFPHNIGLGAANDPELVRSIGEITAREVAVTGIDWAFAPTVAVVHDVRWGRTYEGYAASTDIVSRYARAMVLGLQGEPGAGFLGAGKVIATAKHFIGDGGTWRGIDQGDSRLPREELIARHGAGYTAAIGADVQTVMASFNSWNGNKVHGSRELLTGQLKGAWGFKGLVVSDWNGYAQVPGCTETSCPQAINAGIDMMMAPEDWQALLDTTVRQVEGGQIPLARIDDAVGRILRVKARAGLFDGKPPSAGPFAGRQEVLGQAEHRAVARRAVRESLVLLKNNGGILPLATAGKRVLVAGEAADSIARQSGGWTLSWQGTGNVNGDFPGATSILAGLRDAVRAAGGKVDYSPTGAWQTRPDVAVVVIGETTYAEGQGDSESLDYEGPQGRGLLMLKSLRAQGIPVVTVFLSGRPLWVNREINASDAFVAAWLPGSEGVGVADVLVADAAGKPRFDFRGRLSFPWPGRDLHPADHTLPVSDTLFALGYGLDYARPAPALAQLPENAIGTRDWVERVLLASGRIPRPWSLHLGDSSDWRRPVSGEITRNPARDIIVKAVDHKDVQDARQIVFSGERLGQVYWHSDEPADLRELRGHGGVLQMNLRVDAPPRGPLGLRMDCGYPCAGTLDLGKVLAKATPGRWMDLSVPLACFERAGTDLSWVDAPAVLLTNAPFSVTVSELRLTRNYSKGSLVDCDSVAMPANPLLSARGAP